MSYPQINKMIKRHIFKAVALLWLGSLMGAGLAFLTQVILARQLGAESFGLFSATLAMVTLVAPLAGFGVPQLWLKIFGEEGWKAMRWFKPSFAFVSISTTSVLLSLFLWAFLGAHDHMTRILIFIVSFYVLGQVSVELVSSKLQLEERYMNYTAWQFLPHFARFILVTILAFGFSSWTTPQNIALIYAFVAVVATVASFFQLWQMSKGRFALIGHGEKKVSKLQIPDTKLVFQNAWPFGLAAFFHLIYFQSDIIFLKYMTGDEAAGVYNVAFTVMVAVYLIPGVLYQKFLLPKLHRWAHHEREKFYKVYRLGNLAMLVLGIIAMLLVWLLSDWAVPLLFGNEYTKAIALLNILAISAPIIFVAFSAGATLVTQEHMKRKVQYMGLVAIINVGLNLILIPFYSAIGAAVATVISNLILLMLYYFGANKHVFYFDEK
ncbi:MAG: flippase [Helicobacteraceae bacterium]|jgi:O-antigen/teichoic acid export membrane protein|nr:flippase [Helicobacteraceae bacterium]